MKKIAIYLSIALSTTLFSCLDKEPLDTFTNDKYWSFEANLRAYSLEFYVPTFDGYAQDFVLFGRYFTGDSFNDDMIVTSQDGRFIFPTDPTQKEALGSWNDGSADIAFKNVRKANVMLEKILAMTIEEEAKNHWTGVARFFRAMEYSNLVRQYGDVPYFDRVPGHKVDDFDFLFKNRDSREFVVDQIMADFDFAINNIRAVDGNGEAATTLQVNKYVAAAYMSRWMLFHATWFTYHTSTKVAPATPIATAKVKDYYDAAIRGAEVVMNSNKYSIGNTYNELFSSETLMNNPEVIFYREYNALRRNFLMYYNSKENQEGGITKTAIESYLCADGLPISQSPLYGGTADPSITATFKNRDPRLYQSFVDSVRITGVHTASSPTGYACKKFLNEDWLAKGSDLVNSGRSTADAPTIRFAEVLLNYVEARYEVSKIGGSAFSQGDIDITINKIRKRNLVKYGEIAGVNMPDLQFNGGNPSVGGVVINDVSRDADVEPMLWEIRRERRIELIMEGRRSDDVNRWAKYEYLTTINGATPTDMVLGSWVKRTDYPNSTKPGEYLLNLPLYNPNGGLDEGYIWYMGGAGQKQRTFVKGDINSERQYLKPVPTKEVNLYEIKGYTLSQNPGW